MKEILFGAAYYDEYMPYDRLDKDIEMLKAAGMNVVRIAESTWSTMEPMDGIFDFTHIDRVLDAMHEAGIHVIVGTPTYAVPPWMVKSHPDILAETKNGAGVYGARQIMDITNPAYLFYAERAIRRLLERAAGHPAVIGYQLDNETKYYDTAGKNVQQGFIKYLRKKFHDNLNALNDAFGLNYWSNRINSWEEFPDVRGTINGSLGSEFDKYRRTLVTRFLSWQADIVEEYRKPEQFVTHNFDFEWRGHSFGVQPSVDHFQTSKCLTIAGADIYHPTQDELSGCEIAFGGDLIRSLKQDNYLILETEAQGFPGWVPYTGQLRLQAYSHLASGANSVMYWHWHSIHNSFETYWKGVLSHDFAENDTYLESKLIGKELKEIGSRLVNLKKKNKVALLVSNEALTALEWFPVDADAIGRHSCKYNDIVRWVYDALFHMNVECDFLFPDSENLEDYALIIAPALYAAPESLLENLKKFVENGGHLTTTFKSAMADENVKVYCDVQPHILAEVLGISYNQFTFPRNVSLKDHTYEVTPASDEVQVFMELLKPVSARVLARYDHFSWERYAAVTRNTYGKGSATHIGCMTSEKILREILKDVLKNAGLWNVENDICHPVIIRKGQNDDGKTVTYFLNYSNEVQKLDKIPYTGTDLLNGDIFDKSSCMEILPWNLRILEAEA